jgi:hypothetical protein
LGARFEAVSFTPDTRRHLNRLSARVYTGGANKSWMRTAERLSLLLLALLASTSLSSALADSTDDALNRFYTENMMGQLTGDVPTVGTNSLPSQKKEKVHKGDKTHKSRAVSEQSSQDTDAIYTYRPSASVTGKVYAQYIANQRANPRKSVIEYIQRQFAGNLAENRFDARFAHYGFYNRDVADSFAGLLIVAWETVSNQDASAHPSGVCRVRQRLREILAAKYAGKAITDASKQYDSEYFKVLAVFSMDAKTQDPAAFENLRKTTYEVFLKRSGIELKKLQLTDTGFRRI